MPSKHGYHQLKSNAKLFGMTSNAVASWAISRVLQAALVGSKLSEGHEREQDVLAIVETALAA
ncbi:MAG: hypothetical protein H7318_17545 [Oligoflexus sp.]|nr:hypothetical protein [Oligoflexus sp.]